MAVRILWSSWQGTNNCLLNSSFGVNYMFNILCPDFDFNLPQSMTFNCDSNKIPLDEIISFKIDWNASKVECLQ